MKEFSGMAHARYSDDVLYTFIGQGSGEDSKGESCLYVTISVARVTKHHACSDT